MDVQNSESFNGSLIRFINRNSGSRKPLCFSSDFSDCISKSSSQQTQLIRGNEVAILIIGHEIYKSVKEQKAWHKGMDKKI